MKLGFEMLLESWDAIELAMPEEGLEYVPSLTLRVEGSAPTAGLDGLGADLWRMTGGGTLQKYVYGRFGIYGDGSIPTFSTVGGGSRTASFRDIVKCCGRS